MSSLRLTPPPPSLPPPPPTLAGDVVWSSPFIKPLGLPGLGLSLLLLSCRAADRDVLTPTSTPCLATEKQEGSVMGASAGRKLPLWPSSISRRPPTEVGSGGSVTRCCSSLMLVDACAAAAFPFLSVSLKVERGEGR